MAFRSRTTSLGSYQAGYVTQKSNGLSYGGGTFPLGHSTCEDDNAPGDGQPLMIRHFRKNLPSSNLDGPGKWSVCNGFIPVHYFNTPFQVMSLTGQATIDYIANKTMAGTNPSRPVVDVPIAIFELPEILMLIKRKGEALFSAANVAQTSAEANLIFQFGIKPLVSDLVSLLDFTEHVDRRVKVLKELQKKGGLSRTYRKKLPFHAAGSFSQRLTIHSAGPFLSANIIHKAEEVSWGVAKWVPIPGHPFPKDAEALRALARQAVLGLTIDLATIWEAIPFSWLVDYTIGIGSYFMAHRNIVPVTCTQIYVCRHRIHTMIISPSRDSNLVVGEGSTVSESKSRTQVGFVTPAAHLPFLTGQQMSIIASLGVLKYR